MAACLRRFFIFNDLIYVRFEDRVMLHSSATDDMYFCGLYFLRTGNMKALQDLFSTDYGIMSVVVIVAMIAGLGVAYGVLKSKMAEGAQNARK